MCEICDQWHAEMLISDQIIEDQEVEIQRLNEMTS